MTEEMGSSSANGLTRTCPNGHEVGPDDVVCNRCAHLVDQSEERVLCPNGHSIGQGVAFCQHCGAAVAGNMAGEAATVLDPEPVAADVTEQLHSLALTDSAPAVTAPVPLARYQASSLDLTSTQVGVRTEYPIATSTRPGRFRRNLAPIILLSVLSLLLIGAGVLAYQQHSVADKWMHDDQQEVKKNAGLTSQVHSLNGQVSNLNGQVSNLNGQLSAVANEKAKALDQNAVLSSALQDASSVANDLSTCVDDTAVMISDISDALSSGFVSASAYSDATTAGQVCRQAQSEESALQVVLAGA